MIQDAQRFIRLIPDRQILPLLRLFVIKTAIVINRIMISKIIM